MVNQQVYHDAALLASSHMQPPSHPSFVQSRNMGHGHNYNGHGYQYRGPGQAPSPYLGKRYLGPPHGHGAGRSFTPHHQVNQPHQTPTRFIAPHSHGYASHGPSTYTAPHRCQQF